MKYLDTHTFLKKENYKLTLLCIIDVDNVWLGWDNIFQGRLYPRFWSNPFVNIKASESTIMEIIFVLSNLEWFDLDFTTVMLIFSDTKSGMPSGLAVGKYSFLSYTNMRLTLNQQLAQHTHMALWNRWSWGWNSMNVILVFLAFWVEKKRS